MREMAPLPNAMKLPLVSRVKIMSGLNIAEKRLPQDGRLRLAVRGHDIDLRVATSPTIHGESVVLRLLDRSNLALEFVELGFDDDTRRQFTSVLSQPHGIVLVTGRSEEHTSELQSLMCISYAVFCLKKKNITQRIR